MGFVCVHCSNTVPTQVVGSSHRNHCPHCLWSAHLDLVPGDRRCACRGPMEPIAIWVRPDSEWALIHRCTRCASLRFNRIAGDDDPQKLRELARRPLAHPAFPWRSP
jgi:hypothetical protein